MKISQLCFLATHLTLLGTLVAGIPGCETSNKAQGKSGLSLLSGGGGWGESIEGVGLHGWGECCQPSLDIFGAVGSLTPWTIFDSQNILLCVQLLIKSISTNSSRSETPSLQLFLPGHNLLCTHQCSIITRFTFVLCPRSYPGFLRLLKITVYL